jgi:hypothetical protein
MRFIWLLIFLLLAAGVYLYLNPEMKSQLLNSTSDLGKPATVHAYQWRNAQGEWQITDTLPPAGVEYEHLQHRADENVLPHPPRLNPKQ